MSESEVGCTVGRVCVCRHCGAQSRREAWTGFKCRECGKYTRLVPTVRVSVDEDPVQAGRLKGFCRECGMMVLESEVRCPRCECTTVRLAPPPESRLREYVNFRSGMI